MHGERWAQACQALAQVAETAVRYDPDGVDIYFLNNEQAGRNLRVSWCTMY